MPTPLCRHLHTDGRRCGSPALRGEPFCFHHHATRKPMPHRTSAGAALPQLPAPDDFLAIQRGLGEVLRLLALDKLTDRRAQTLLNGLAKASANLARHHRREDTLAAQAHAAGTPRPEPVTDFVHDEQYGTLAPNPNPSPNPNPNPDEQAAAETAAHPLPDPLPLLTPDPTHATFYDEYHAQRMQTRLAAQFHQERLAFEAAKQAELADLAQTLEARFTRRYEARYTALAQTLEARYAVLAQTFETRLRYHDTQTATTRTPTLYPPQPRRLQLPSRIPNRIPTQQNQDLRINPQPRPETPTQPAG